MADSLAWVAGIMEGEGSFGAHKSGRLPLVQLAMCDQDVVERVAAVFPMRVTTYNRSKPGLTTRKQMYRAVWTGNQAADLMWAILPYMGERRTEKILSILADWYEDRMRVCLACSIEFPYGAKRGSRRKYCSFSCADLVDREQKKNGSREAVPVG